MTNSPEQSSETKGLEVRALVSKQEALRIAKEQHSLPVDCSDPDRVTGTMMNAVALALLTNHDIGIIGHEYRKGLRAIVRETAVPITHESA